MVRIQRAGVAAGQSSTSLPDYLQPLNLIASVQDDLKEQQKPLVDALLKVVLAPEPYPSPGRPIRQLVAQSLEHVYNKGDTRTLYDTVQTLLKIPLDPKLATKDVHRV